MKKVLGIFLVLVICFTFAGCGSKEIELTTLNYDDYLVLDLRYKMSEYNPVEIKGVGVTGHDYIQTDFKVSAKSNKFNYYACSLKIRIYGTYISWSYMEALAGKGTGSTKELDETITIYCNLDGSGSYSDLIELDGFSYMNALNIAYEVVEISGWMEPS